MRLWRYGVKGLVLALLAGCAIGAEQQAEFSRVATAEIARHPSQYTNGDARAYLVAYKGTVHGLLWGSMHVNYSTDTMPPAPIRERMVKAVDLTTEWPFDTFSGADYTEMTARGKRYLETPSEDEVARLDAATRAELNATDLPRGIASRFSLRGLAALVLGMAARDPLGYTGSTGPVDTMLIGFSRKTRAQLRDLDTREEKLAIFAGAPNDADAVFNLKLALRRAPDYRAFSKWILSEYGQGQIAMLVAATEAWKAEADDLVREAHARTTLNGRNALWIPKLDAILQKSGEHFIVFGAGHLLGEDGVVALLRAKGWQVLPCPGDVCPTL